MWQPNAMNKRIAFEMTGSELVVDKCGYATEAQQAEIVLMAQAQQNLAET